MSKEKSAFTKYKPFWDYGIKLIDYDNKISVFLKNYCVNQIFKTFKKNNSILKESEKKEFELMIKQLIEDKKQLGKDPNCTVEEYLEFLSDVFSKVDDEDRHGEITVNTSFSFKLVGDLIDVLTVWGEIPEEWLKKKKYCKFKAVDIYKCIKQGILPKRGGPKEEDDDISKELSEVAIKENLIYEGSREELVQTDNINKNRADYNPHNKYFSDNVPPYYEITHNEPLIEIIPSSQNTIKYPHESNRYEDLKLDIEAKDDNYVFTSSKEYAVDKTLSPKTNGIQNTRFFNDHYVNHVDDSIHHKNCAKNSFIPTNYKIDPKIQKKISFSLPVKYKSIDYFRLTEIIFKLLENGIIEMKSDKVDKALVQLELALYYLHNVDI